MAQHAILRFEKHKGNPARPLEAHHERQKEQYASNPDIDTSRSKYNFHMTMFWAPWLMKQVKRRKNPSARKRYLQKSRESQRRMK